MAQPVVIGVDIGTTATKVVAFDVSGRVYGEHSAGYPLEEPSDGQAVQDPDAILAAVVEGIRAAAAASVAQAAVVRGLSFSAALHTLIALDADGTPLTPSITWADTRAAEQADRLRARPDGLENHRRTGTPVHAMSPLPKLIWFREHEPRVFAAARHWVGIKEYVLHRLTGEYALDVGIASATGLLDRTTLDWYAPALTQAGVTRDQLSPLVPTTYVLGGLTSEAARRLGLDPATAVVVGGSDGPLANLGLGAVRPGVAAVSIGTSGALRVSVDRPAVDARGQVFCYALTADRWVVGGAINNGGAVLQWAADALAPDLDGDTAPQLLDLAAAVPPGSEGLLMLPYLLGERAPHWGSLARGAYVGLERSHRRGHLVRAAIEGVCLQLALVLRSVEDAGNEVHEIRATGGFARSSFWRQLLANVLGRPVGFPVQEEGSSFGAALIGMRALGLIDNLDVAADLVRIEETLAPEPRAAAVYRELLPVFERLYDALVPAFTELRDVERRHRETLVP